MNPLCEIAALLVALVLLTVGLRAATAEPASRRIKSAAGLDVHAMLKAIRQVESGEKPGAIGPRGERSAYQFMPGTWGIHTDAPFLAATTNPALADSVAWEHLDFICAQLARRNLPREPMFIAAAWRHGPGFALALVRSDYAQRTANLYWDQCQ